jgi:hypothetical protein
LAPEGDAVCAAAEQAKTHAAVNTSIVLKTVTMLPPFALLLPLGY